MKILYSEKNGDTGEQEVTVKILNSEIKWLKTAVTTYIDKGFGDNDDADQIGVGEDLRKQLLECKNLLNP